MAGGRRLRTEVPPLNFTCSLTRVLGTVTVTPSGDIDMSATTQLREALQTAARTDDVERIVVDLAGVTFLDSTALGVLIAAHTAAQRRDAAFTVINPGPMVTMVLTMTGLFDVLVGPSGTASDEPAEPARVSGA